MKKQDVCWHTHVRHMSRLVYAKPQKAPIARGGCAAFHKEGCHTANLL